MRLLAIFILLCSAKPLLAQDWRTVRLGDTTYFMGAWEQTNPDDSGRLLRYAWIASSAANGPDSLFSFFPTIRAANAFPTQCLDTVAPHWLGRYVIRKASGEEQYFNSFGDTITIRTSASLNDSWTLAHDTAGRAFRATITSIGTMLIDGVVDSFKTATIQALNGPTLAASGYNNKVLQWTKSRGWLKTLDFYVFPNPIPYNLYWTGVLPDSSQHERLPKHFNNQHLSDASERFTPGNEWITEMRYGLIPYQGASRQVIHDSIISSVPYGVDSRSVTYRRRFYQHEYIWQNNVLSEQKAYTDLVRTDTFGLANLYPVRDFLKPDYQDVPLYFIGTTDVNWYKSSLLRRFFVKPVCNDKYIVMSRRAQGASALIKDSCWKVSSVSAGTHQVTNMDVIPTLGIVGSSHYSSQTQTVQTGYSRTTLEYLRTGSCVIGTKTDVSTLAIGFVEKESFVEISLSPNPTSQSATLSNLPAEPLQISLIDITGRTLSTTTTTGPQHTLSTAYLPAGIFFFHVRGKSSSRVLKLEVIH